MPSRSRKQWKPDVSGVFTRQVGYTRTASGKLSQPKFRLGTDSREAKRRVELIRQLWDHLEATHAERPVAWPDYALEAAKQIGKGQSHFAVSRGRDEEAGEYAQRVSKMRRLMPMLAVVPHDEVDYAIGATVIRAVVDNMQHARKTIDSMSDMMLEPYRDLLDPDANHSGPMFHATLREHAKWIEKEYRSPETGTITDWGRVRVKRVQSLIDHHRDLPLNSIDLAKTEELFLYWRQRPPRKGTDEPVARKSASNQITALKDFIAWLHRSQEHDWRKPEDFDMIETRVATLPKDRRQQVMPDVLFSLEELVLLNKYATPLERLILLLGVNCGFGRAEIASLLVGETFIRHPHDKHHQEILRYPMTPEDSFIKRVRRKNMVYGEHVLFPQTVQAIEWAIDNRKRFDGFGPDARLLLNNKGQPYDKPTKSGNPNQQISNRFSDLCDRVRDDDDIDNEIRSLSFGKVRKTAGDLIRRFSDGETAGVFLCHGQPVKSDSLADVYSSRPFGRVFKAIREVQEYLRPVFEAAGPEPFEAQPQAYTRRSTIDRILELHAEGQPPTSIAEIVGKSLATVQRHITKANGPRRPGRPTKPR